MILAPKNLAGRTFALRVAGAAHAAFTADPNTALIGFYDACNRTADAVALLVDGDPAAVRPAGAETPELTETGWIFGFTDRASDANGGLSEHRLTVRLPPTLVRAARDQADARGVSLNQFVVDGLRAAVLANSGDSDA